ncbi:MAG: type II secretion system protein GspJ [Candidatus Ratteibacteria bacterium]|jgi:type II secretion system protein J
MKTRKGFTLVEVMVAVVIFSLAIAVIYKTFSTGLKVWERGSESMAVFQDGKRVLDVISKDIRSTFIPPLGNEDSLFVGEDKKEGEIDADKISFFTLGEPNLISKGKDIGLRKIEYYLEKKDKEYTLYRKETPSLGRLVLGEETVDPLLIGVENLNFEYYSKGEWKKEWKPSKTVPSRVKICLKLKEETGEPHTFATTVEVPVASEETEKE